MIASASARSNNPAEVSVGRDAITRNTHVTEDLPELVSIIALVNCGVDANNLGV